MNSDIYCPVYSLTDGLPGPTDLLVVVGASIRLDAKLENLESWVCTGIHDLWIPKVPPANTRENPCARHPEVQV